MIKKIGSNKYGVVEYAISSVEDIADLPLGVAIGSTAVLINKDGIRTFALGEGEWVEYIDAERYDKNKLAQDLLFCGFGNDGEKHDDLDDRLIVEFDEINERVNVGNYLEYNGCDVKADYSLEGLQRGVMLEGRTLQNLVDNKFSTYGTSGLGGALAMTYANGYMEYETLASSNTTYITIRARCQKMMKNNTTYTIIFDIRENTIPNYRGVTVSGADDCFFATNENRLYHSDEFNLDKGVKKIVVTIGANVSEYTGFGFGFPSVKTYNIEEGLKFTIGNVMVLEGDYTQTPLEELPFIEGIESVGESELTDEGHKISGKSCGRNLFDKTKLQKNCRLNTGTGGIIETTDNNCITNYIQIKPNANYCYYYGETYVNRNVCFYDEAYNFVGYLSSEEVKEFTTPQNAKYIRLNCFLENLSVTQLEENDTNSSYEPYQESTYSYILDEPLRSLPNGVCDTIDLETGVLTRRVGKVVLDGSERVVLQNTSSEIPYFNYTSTEVKRLPNNAQTGALYCDRFIPTTVKHTYNGLIEGVSQGGNGNYIQIAINKNKLSTIDDEGLSDWLQANPTTVLYELAEPTIHQLNPSRIYSFKDVTHITSDNLIAPRITTNILTNSNALISHLRGENLALANEVSALSLRNGKMQETNETQDHIIDASLCAVDELYMMYETTQEVEAMSADEEGSRMVDMYVAMVQRGLKTIDQVPVRYREKVREILAQLED